MPLVSSERHGGLSSRHSQRSKYGDGFRISDEVDQNIAAFVENDNNRDKTWTRLIVEKYLSKWTWYFPMRDKPNGPDLSKAYAFYEHVTLPRYFSGGQETGSVQRKAERGEFQEETRLYNPFFTKAVSLGEWGIAIDSYFTSLKYVAFMLLVAGIMNWYNMRYFASSEYSDDKQGSLPAVLQGSAICTSFEWVACPTCSESNFDASTEEKARFAVTQSGLILVSRNACGNDLLPVGMVNYFTFFLLLITLFLYGTSLNIREIRADEDKLTATDYSIVVRNPPYDAYDPDVWRNFFERFAENQVTCVTVAINNEKMLRKLIARRVHRNNLRLMLPPGSDMDDEDLVLNLIAQLEREKESEPKGILRCIISTCVRPLFNIFLMFLPPQSLFDRMVKLTEEIKELQKEDYFVTSVFVTFETEEGQRKALSALSVGRIHSITNNTQAVVPGVLFEGCVLHVEEPAEPSAVRWLDLSSDTNKRILMRILNAAITLGIVTIAGVVVGAVRSSVGPRLSGPLVSVFNSIIPQIVKLLMIFEPHLSEGSFQTSLYLKITLFRWINTAILTKLITPFTRTLTDGGTDLLPSIVAIFWSELIITPALRLIDMFGNIKKHILAPRSRTQEQMNSNFQGTYYNLGERYTDFSKVLFLCFFYSSLLPSSFIFGFAILMTQHYVDKYCLMRIWGWTPTIGPELARFSRRYFFYGALLAFILVSAYAWAQFPYDNICDPDQPSGFNYSGSYNNVKTLNNEFKNVTVTQSEEVVYCQQSWRAKTGGLSFPATSRLQPSDATWMSSSQEELANVYGWTSLGVFISFFLILFGNSGFAAFVSFFRHNYKPSGKVQRIDFSANPEIFAYVPQIKLPSFPFPLVACDIDDLHKELIGWADETRSYDYYNLLFDVPYEGMKRTERMDSNSRKKKLASDSKGSEKKTAQRGHVSVGDNAVEVEPRRKPIFSVIKHYPPPWLQKILESDDTDQDSKETLTGDRLEL
ncbi:hypothetical protein ACA910_010325 [Epithemia clementina (nom. ined.)]